jgi:hypothetical protein
MVDGEYAAMAMIGLYFLWYHWFIVRAGLGLGVLGAMGFVALSSLCIGLFSAGPMLIDWVFYGVVPHY